MTCSAGPTLGSFARGFPQGSQRSREPMVEVCRLVEILVACAVQPSAAPTSDPLVEFFPLPVCVDPPRIWLVTRCALTRPGLLAIGWARQAGKATTSWLFVKLVPVTADFFPWPREAAGLGVVCSFSGVCYPVEEEEKRTLGVRNSKRGENVVEWMTPHRDSQTRAVVKV